MLGIVFHSKGGLEKWWVQKQNYWGKHRKKSNNFGKRFNKIPQVEKQVWARRHSQKLRQLDEINIFTVSDK